MAVALELTMSTPTIGDIFQLNFSNKPFDAKITDPWD
jgi:hypothetical protein